MGGGSGFSLEPCRLRVIWLYWDASSSPWLEGGGLHLYIRAHLLKVSAKIISKEWY